MFVYVLLNWQIIATVLGAFLIKDLGGCLVPATLEQKWALKHATFFEVWCKVRRGSWKYYASYQPSKTGQRALEDTGLWRGPNCSVDLATGNYQKFSYALTSPKILYPHSFIYPLGIQTNERKASPLNLGKVKGFWEVSS